MLYLEGPGNIGFSYTIGAKNKVFSDISATQDFYEGLMGFFKLFPKIADNKVYIAGESYAGIYVPYLAWRLHEFNTNADITGHTKIDFQGIMVGNPTTHWDYDTYNSYYPMAYMHNLMDTDTWFTLAENYCKYYYRNVKPPNTTSACIFALDDFTENTENINWYDIYRDLNEENGPRPPRMATTVDEDGKTVYYERGVLMSEYTPWLAPHLTKNDYRLGDTMTDYLNLYETRRELHIPKEIEPFRVCEADMDWTYKLQPEGSYWLYPLLKANGYKILVYSGDTDGAVPLYGT